MIANQIFWDNAEDDEFVFKQLDKWAEWVEATGEERGILRDFIYLNYADKPQPVYESSVSKCDLARMKEIQAMYDPDLVLETLIPGGFKLPH